MPLRILVSAGETSGDLYAASLTLALRNRFPEADFFGCAGPRMRAAGVDPVVDMASLAVVGLAEVVSHLPRIYGEFRKIVGAARDRRPDVAILTDSPDFHLRLAKKLKKLGIPVVYLVAPQAWAWRSWRVNILKRNVERLLCIFPFEEPFFSRRGVPARYIGHPLACLLKPAANRLEFRRKFKLEEDQPLVVLLPGSRRGEVVRHIPDLSRAVDEIRAKRECQFLLATPLGFGAAGGNRSVEESWKGHPVRIVEGETWEAIAAADVALAASGTVTIEVALLGIPMVTFYRVSRATWYVGRPLVNVPFYSMVNLVAGREIVPELIQTDLTAARLAGETMKLLDDDARRSRMREGLLEVARLLGNPKDPIEQAADEVEAVVRRN